MRLHVKPIEWYVNRLQNGDHFSFAGYSDAEWLCILGLREGGHTALGQTLSSAHGSLLAAVLRRRQHDKRFLFAVPICLLDGSMDVFGDGIIDWWLGKHSIIMEAYERDSILDDLAAKAGLYPLIYQLQRMDLCVTGPKELAGLDFLRMKNFVPISTPNLHMEPGGIDDAVNRVLARPQKVTLVSAGVSAAVIIDKLCDALPVGSFLIDCGSIWDAFVGIGGQRQWRAELYRDEARLIEWKRANVYGPQEPGGTAG